MTLTQEEFDAKVSKAANEAAEKILAEKLKAADEVKKTNLRQEMQEVYETAEREREAKGYKAEGAELKLAKLVNLYANAGGDAEKMAKLSEKMYPEDKETNGYVRKALEAGVPSAGGFGIPQVLSSRVIDILYAQTILDKAGVSKIPMVNGNMRLTRMDSAASAGWVGELPSNGITQPGFGEVILSAKKMFAMSEISNDLIRYNSVGIEGWLARELQRRAKLLIDYAAFYGPGSSYSPGGLAVRGVQTLGSSSTAIASTHPDAMIALVEQANVPMTNCGWAMSPQMKSWLKGLKATTGQFIFRDEIVKENKLCGYPIYTSTQISYTDTSTDYADLWFGDFDELLWGTGLDLELRMSQDAAYVSGGTTYSTFQRDSQLVRVVAEHDFNVMHPAAFVQGTFSVS